MRATMMTRTAVASVLLGAGMWAWPALASAQQAAPWSLSFDLGAQAPVNGNVHAGGSGVVLGLPAQVSARSYGDVYGAGFAWSAGLGYRLAPRSEIRVQGNVANTTADRLQVGTVAGLPLLALFDDYRSFGLEVGYRQYLGDGMVRPFVGGGVGFVRLATLAAEFSVPDAGVVLSNVDFLDSSVVPAFGGGGGVQARLSERLSVQGRLELRWHGDATDLDGLAGTGLEPINDRTRRWTLPVTGGITVHF
jgi:hypothetical protein